MVAATRDERLEDWMMALLPANASSHRDHRQPGADVHLPGPPDHGHPAADRARARRPGPGDRVLRPAPRPARAGGAARARTPRRRRRRRGCSTRNGGVIARAGKIADEPGRAVPGGRRGGDHAAARPGAHDRRGQHRDRAAADRARRPPGTWPRRWSPRWPTARCGDRRRRSSPPGWPRSSSSSSSATSPAAASCGRSRSSPRARKRVAGGDLDVYLPVRGPRRDRRPHPRLQRHGEQDPRGPRAPGGRARRAGAHQRGAEGGQPRARDPRHHRRPDQPLQPPPLPGRRWRRSCGSASSRAGRSACSSSTSTTSRPSTTAGATRRATPRCGGWRPRS